MCGGAIASAVIGGALGAGGGILGGWLNGRSAKKAAERQIAEMKKMNQRLIEQQKLEARNSKRLMINSTREEMKDMQRTPSVEKVMAKRQEIRAEHKVVALSARLNNGKNRIEYHYPKPFEDIKLGNEIEEMFG